MRRIRICKSDTCSNELHRDDPWNQKYCSTDCYADQNRINTKIRRRKAQESQEYGVRVCKLDTCLNQWNVDKFKQSKLFCSKECKQKNANRTQNEIRQLNRVEKELKTAKPTAKKIGRQKSVYTHKCATCDNKVAKTVTVCRQCVLLSKAINPKWLAPRGFKQRRELGLPDTDYARGHGCSISASA